MSDNPNEILTGTLTPEGYTAGPSLFRDKIMKCPHRIMVAKHYRLDDSCRCDDPAHIEMEEWEYTWDGERWV